MWKLSWPREKVTIKKKLLSKGISALIKTNYKVVDKSLLNYFTLFL